jgi:hypothetical protein
MSLSVGAETVSGEGHIHCHCSILWFTLTQLVLKTLPPALLYTHYEDALRAVMLYTQAPLPPLACFILKSNDFVFLLWS